MRQFITVLLLITLCGSHQAQPQGFCQWLMSKIRPTRAQENMLIASGTKFLADQAFKNLHILIPAGLLGGMSLTAMQQLQEENSFWSSTISWTAGALGQIAVVRHLEDSSPERIKSFAERLTACLMSASISALVYRVGADYILMLDPTAITSVASSGLIVVSVLAGTYITIKSSYIAGHHAQNIYRWGKQCFARLCRCRKEHGPLLPLTRTHTE